MSRALRAILLLGLCLCLQFATAAKSNGPLVSETRFDSVPVNLFYFDDSHVVIVEDFWTGKVFRSADSGSTWTNVTDIDYKSSSGTKITPHPYNNKVAVALGEEKTHWITKDQGASWQKFYTEHPTAWLAQPLSFHASDADKFIINTMGCDLDRAPCANAAMYTKDGAKTMTQLTDKIYSCMWSKTTDVFTTGNKDDDDNQIICIAEGKFSERMKDSRLLTSSDYFRTSNEPVMDGGRPLRGLKNIAPVKGFIAIATKLEQSKELELWTSDNAKEWHQAEFNNHRLEEDAYTILESTNYSMQVDVISSSWMNPMGTLFTSNSNGTYFTQNIQHTNRNTRGFVDFEKIQNIQGLVLVNVVDNWKEVDDGSSFDVSRKIITKMSFDDGRTWQALKVGEDDLQLHSVTDLHNIGRVFSSAAPGIVMGVGNTGSSLKSWSECDTYVSDDAGATWKFALKGPHIYAVGGAGSLLVAVPSLKSGSTTKQIKYSINHGKDWLSYELEHDIQPFVFQTLPDSSNLKFLLIAEEINKDDKGGFTIFLDFEGLHERVCKESDFERWAARVDKKGNPTCVMGHKQFFRRRKADAECFVDEEFKDPVPEYEPCVCTAEDYECDFNFVKSDSGECIPAGPLALPKGVCKSPEDKFKASSGYRLIPGNACIKTGGVIKDEPVERPCKESGNVPASGNVTSEVTKFESSKIREYYYLQASRDDDGDSIIFMTAENHIWITHDSGKRWERVLAKADQIAAIYPHTYFSDVVYLITTDTKVYYSLNRGKDGRWEEFDVPEAPNRDHVQILGFHPTQRDWLLYTGGKGCKPEGECHTVAHYSQNGGLEWHVLREFVKKCKFVTHEKTARKEEMVACEGYPDKDPKQPKQLVSTNDWFVHTDVKLNDIITFATMSEFIVVASHSNKTSLKLDASVDGISYAQAHFPPNFEVLEQHAYTVLDSSTHSIFLHVTVNSETDKEYGSLIKSNSNGTSYALSLSHVNRNKAAYVDFEKMQGLEGVALANIISNIPEIENGKGDKKLRTLITHNDGAEWAPMRAPDKDSLGVKYNCDVSNTEKCSLHLHGYTERKDPRNTYSSASAIGLMIGVGNVGPSLDTFEKGNTFITRDAGLTWREAFKGTYTWEFGDQGSVIVIVKRETPVKEVHYTRDEGATWSTYQFSEEPMTVTEISTVPNDDSLNFLLWARIENKMVTVNLDFSGLTTRQCELEENDHSKSTSDYEIWTPTHPISKDDCLFGHVAQYHRKKIGSDCYNGRKFHQLHDITKTCECSRRDFECDYNYERQKDGSCKLVAGLKPMNHALVCNDPNVVEWYEPTGYRKIPISTCEGGKELEFSATVHPCPGHEKEFSAKHALSPVALFFAITVPIICACAAGWYVWRNWDGKFGRIRLGDGQTAGDGSFTKWPIFIISGIVAVISALPVLGSAIWSATVGRLSGRSTTRDGYTYNRPYTTRDSFQNRRSDYTVVEEDEGELLGEDSDEEGPIAA